MNVYLEPIGSPYAAAIQAAAGRIPEMVELHVVDRARAPGALVDEQTVVISDHDEPNAFDVVAPSEVESRLYRVFRNFVRAAALRARLSDVEIEAASLDEVGRALSDVQDLDRLLSRVLAYARRLCAADAGSIYLVEGNELRFVAAANDTVRLPVGRPTLTVDPSSLAGWVASTGQFLMIPDVRDLPDDAPYRFNSSFDQATGYRTRSMLLLPLRGRTGQVHGVLALLNHKSVAGVPIENFSRVSPFQTRDLRLASSIASSASVALDNHRLIAESQRLFDGFVEASVAAIEDRDPATGGHSQRVARLTLRLAEAMSELPEYASLRSPTALTELRYASLLHDFGKVSVREEVLRKGGRVHPWELLEMELHLHHLFLSRPSAEGGLSAADRGGLDAERRWLRQLVDPRYRLENADLDRLRDLGDRLRAAGIDADRTLARLAIRAGTLDAAERDEMRLHVSCSWRFLSRIPWTNALRAVPDIAFAHHERLDGSGYPRALSGDHIPVGAQLMAVADVFDALTAFDRPYRDGVPPERALQVLRAEAREGKLLIPAVELLEARELWRGITERGRS